MSPSRPPKDGVADENGEMVQRFTVTMNNLGLARAGEELVTMLTSARWQHWSQGGMRFDFLPGEFDYFLSQQGIQREQVMVIPDIETKAKLEEAMDERRTGDSSYRRSVIEARSALPSLPGRPVVPYGYGKVEAKALADEGSAVPPARPALGDSVRRYRNNGGKVVKPPKDERPRWAKLADAGKRLPDEELDRLLAQLTEERTSRGGPKPG